MSDPDPDPDRDRDPDGDPRGDAESGGPRHRAGAAPRRRARHRRRDGRARPLLAAGLAVLAVAGLFGPAEVLGKAAAALWSARWDRLIGPAAAVEGDPAGLRDRILAILNDPATLRRGPEPVVAAAHAIEDCALVLRVRFDPGACARSDAAAPGSRRLRALEHRVELGHLLTHPAFVADAVPIAAGDGAGPRSAVRWRWLPRIGRQSRIESENFQLLQGVLDSAATAPERAALAAAAQDEIDAGGLGPHVLDNHLRMTGCDGRETVAPLGPDSAAFFAAPDRREELLGLVHAYARARCGPAGWLF